MEARNPPRRGRKILIASIGAATVSFGSCVGTAVGNLVAPPPCDDAGNIICTPDAPAPDAGTGD